MLKISCRISPENEKTITAMLNDFGIIRDDSAEIILLESGLSSSGGLVITFDPERLDLLEEFLAQLRETPTAGECLIIGSRHNTLEPIAPADILFFKADGNYVFAVTASGKYEVKNKLYELEQRLGGGNFIRTGKSCIVNILKVKEIIPWFGSRLLLRISETEDRVEVSRNYLKSFKQYLGMMK